MQRVLLQPAYLTGSGNCSAAYNSDDGCCDPRELSFATLVGEGDVAVERNVRDRDAGRGLIRRLSEA